MTQDEEKRDLDKIFKANRDLAWVLTGRNDRTKVMMEILKITQLLGWVVREVTTVYSAVQMRGTYWNKERGFGNGKVIESALIF